MKSLDTVRGIEKELRNNSDMMIREVVSRKAEIFRWRDDCSEAVVVL